jgi:hypothetical protein
VVVPPCRSCRTPPSTASPSFQRTVSKHDDRVTTDSTFPAKTCLPHSPRSESMLPTDRKRNNHILARLSTFPTRYNAGGVSYGNVWTPPRTMPWISYGAVRQFARTRARKRRAHSLLIAAGRNLAAWIRIGTNECGCEWPRHGSPDDGSFTVRPQRQASQFLDTL